MTPLDWPGPYNQEMARGWESKSIEAQIEGAREDAPSPKRQLTPEQQEKAREIERLRLSQTYLKQQIAGTSHPARAQALQKAMQEIEHKLAWLQRA